jgi:homoserine kinase type II
VAVYTEVPDEALATFLADYDLGKLLSMKGIAEGVENSNFLLHTEAGSFILTLYEKRVKADDLPFFIGLMDHLAARGLVCPQPVKRRGGGDVLGSLAGRPAALVTFLEGLSVRRPTATHCAAAGAALAELHAAGEDFGQSRPNGLTVEAWRPLLDQARPGAEQVAAGLTAFLDEELAFLEAHWPRDLPIGIVHADLFPDNVLFLGDNVSGLIDFYFACTDAYAYDLAICLNAWCFEPDGSYNLTKGAGMVNAYRARRPLCRKEIAAFPVLARGAAIRFALTRLVDWLNVPPGAMVQPKDPAEYVQKLRFYRRVGSVGELGFVP